MIVFVNGTIESDVKYVFGGCFAAGEGFSLMKWSLTLDLAALLIVLTGLFATYEQGFQSCRWGSLTRNHM